jgi:ABC-2 type transport system permease protein
VSIVRAERRRLLKRRFTKWLLVVGVLILGAVAAGVFFTNHKASAETYASAQQEAHRQYQEQLGYWNAAGGSEKCKQDNKDAIERKGISADEVCRGPQEADYQPEWFMPPTFNFKSDFPDLVIVWAAIMGLLAFVIGASYVGAEWNSGAMMNLLLWRPKRGVVLSAKLGTLLGVTAVWSTLIGIAWTGFFWLTGEFRGTNEGMTSGTWQSLGLRELRGLALILFLAAVGFALASLGRHTAMALGVAAAFVVVFQFGVGIALSLAQVRFIELYLLPTHLVAWMDKAYTAYDGRSCEFSSGACQPETFTLTWGQTGTGALILAAVLIGGAYWSMQRRDVA